MAKANNVFIAALPRSGSTLLGMMLGANSRICHIGESAYWSKLNVYATKCCCGAVGCKTLIEFSEYLSDFQDQIRAIHTACGVIDLNEEPNKIRHSFSLSARAFTQSANSELLIRECCNGLDKIAEIARRVFNKDIVIENSKYLSIAESLLKDESDWKILIITRDPRGIAYCSKNAGERKNVSRPIKDKMDLFLSFAERAASLLKCNDVLLVQYEDLCRNTIETLERICDFIGVSFEAKMLRFKDYKGHLLMGNRMMYDTNQEIVEDSRWRKYLSIEERELFARNDLIQAYTQLGYDLTKDL